MRANVLFLHISSDWIRGSENALLTLLRGLDRNKVTPSLFCGNKVLAETAEAEGIYTIADEIPQIMMDGWSVQLPLWRWVKALSRILDVIAQRNIQLIYCNGASTCQLGYYAAKIRRLPVVCHVHSPYNRRHILLYRFHRASKVIFVSKATEISIRRKHPFTAACEVVHNGVDTSSFRPAETRDMVWRERLGVPPDAIVFGQVSSLIPRKGIDILLRAFHLVAGRYPKSHLVLVGDGPDRSDYVAQAQQLGIADKVLFVGHQPDPLPYYQHVFDVNVLASRSEALPLTLLEGAACGLPNIGARVDGIPEAILDESTGLLFEPEDHAMLAEKMSLLIRAPHLRPQFAEAGRQLVVQRFSLEKYCRSVEDIILGEIASANRSLSVPASTKALPQ